jgi:hypothetical protein
MKSSSDTEGRPILVVLGGVALGWIAGQIALADPAIAGWAQRDAPALSIVLPALGAVLVFWESRILIRARRRDKPFRKMAPAAAVLVCLASVGDGLQVVGRRSVGALVRLRLLGMRGR